MLSDDHSEHLLNELLLSSGHHYRERDAGRIDLKLPWKHPFNATALVANPLIYSVLDSILGSGFELKSVHAIHALPERRIRSGIAMRLSYSQAVGYTRHQRQEVAALPSRATR